MQAVAATRRPSSKERNPSGKIRSSMTRLTSRSATQATTAASAGFSISAPEPMAASNINIPIDRNIYRRRANFNGMWLPAKAMGWCPLLLWWIQCRHHAGNDEGGLAAAIS